MAGAYIASILNADTAKAYGLELVARSNDPAALTAELGDSQPDILLLEFGRLDETILREVESTIKASRAQHALVAYRFARSTDEQLLLSRGNSLTQNTGIRRRGGDGAGERGLGSAGAYPGSGARPPGAHG